MGNQRTTLSLAGAVDEDMFRELKASLNVVQADSWLRGLASGFPGQTQPVLGLASQHDPVQKGGVSGQGKASL